MALNSLTINGKIFKIHEIQHDNFHLADCTDFEKDTLNFIHDWLNGKKEFSIQTSGSTGSPKKISLTRDQMQNSARRSVQYFQLAPGMRLLCCLPTQYIAGKMMLVRGLEGQLQLDIITPTANPLHDISHGKTINFVAMTPMQAEQSLATLRQPDQPVRMLLIGGAGIHPSLEKELQTLSIPVFHSYAMTETITHVAIRQVNGPNASDIYTALPGVTFSQDAKKCLKIHDELLGIHSLQTNDLVTLLSKTSFRWTGRADLTVNSGGVKIQLEKVEIAIRDILNRQHCSSQICLVAMPDKKLSQKLVLLIGQDYPGNLSELAEKLRSALPAYHAPRQILAVPQLFYTKTGKPDQIKNMAVYLAKENE